MTRYLPEFVKRRSCAPRASRIGSCFALILASLSGFTAYACAADFAVLHNGFSIRHERREVLGSITRLYVTADRKGYVDVPTQDIDRFESDATPAATLTPRELPELVNIASSRYHLDPDLVNSVIHAESGFNPRAVSPKGAKGLMQLMPQTASQLGVANSLDPQQNVEGGTRYLRELLERYDFDLVKALAAYNAGPHRVEQYHGIPPYNETQAYVARIVRDFNRKKLAEQKTGKRPAPAKTAPAAKTLTATQATPPKADTPR